MGPAGVRRWRFLEPDFQGACRLGGVSRGAKTARPFLCDDGTVASPNDPRISAYHGNRLGERPRYERASVHDIRPAQRHPLTAASTDASGISEPYASNTIDGRLTGANQAHLVVSAQVIGKETIEEIRKWARPKEEIREPRHRALDFEALAIDHRGSQIRAFGRA